MSIRLLTVVFEMHFDNPTEKLVLLALADQANDEGVCWPSMRRVAKRACVAIRQARRIIEMLEERGLVRRQMRFNSSSVYHVTLPPVTDDRGGHAVPEGEVTDDRTPGHPVPPNRHRTVNEPSTTLSGKPDAVKGEPIDWKAFAALSKPSLVQQALHVLWFINSASKRNYRASPPTMRMIEARLKDYDVQQLKNVVALKADQWAEDPKMRMYLRPMTLFNATNFENYVAEAEAVYGKQTV